MDGIRNLVERFVAFENRWDACEREVRAHVEASRLAGIREAIAIVFQECQPGNGELFGRIDDRLRALLPPPSGGEKVDPAGKCVLGDACRHYPPETCPVHAPKPAAEKP